MSELPPRTCGECKNLGKYERVAENHGDYLQANTIPKPDLIHKEKVTLHDPKLSTPATYYPSDLNAPIAQIGNSKNLDDCCCPEIEGKKSHDCKNSPYTLQKFGEDSLNPRNQNAPKFPISETKQIKGILKTKQCACPPQQLGSQAIPQPKKEMKEKNKIERNKEEKSYNLECYMPKPQDDFPAQRDDENGNLGAWATGRLDWGPLAGLTGIRPVVDKYSVARFSEGEWRMHNKKVLDGITEDQHKADMADYNAKSAMETIRVNTDKNQADSTRMLHQREQELHRWKCELERAISASMEEISLMQEQRRRLKQSMAVLQLPEAIAGECLERRTGRGDSELVRDEVEEELIKEMALTAIIREQFSRILVDVEHQLLEDKTAKNRLEYDWSDKKQADEIECVNVALNDRSNILLFKPGAVGFPDHQSTQDNYEIFTRETLEESEITRQRSAALRGTLDAILNNAARDLRAQADKVDLALAKRIGCMEEIQARLESELLVLLKRLADIESTVINLRDMVRRMDVPLKKCQTRLDNRLMYRPRVENCRDAAQYGLVDEAKTISENVASLMAQLRAAEDIQSGLMMARGSLEQEIMAKRKTLQIDRDRAKMIRSHYPSASAMAGY